MAGPFFYRPTTLFALPAARVLPLLRPARHPPTLFASPFMVSAALRLYFENPVGRRLEQPAGACVVVEYRAGPRQFSDPQAFLTHAG